MADVQLSNGHIRIATELFEALCRIRINGEARQVMDTIIRKTYGWDKKEDVISLSQFCLATGLSKSTVSRGIKKLLLLNLITQKGKMLYPKSKWFVTQKGNEYVKTYRFNKDFDTWKPLSKKEKCFDQKVNLSQKVNGLLTKRYTTIDTIQKINTISHKKLTNPDIGTFIGFYCQEFEVRFKEKPVVSGKDAGLVKMLFVRRSLEQMKEVLTRFFESDDKFIIQAGYGLSIFYAVFNKLLTVKQKGEVL